MKTLSAWRDEGRSFTWRGHRIRHWEGGGGNAPPLLLIHGFPTASWDWHLVWDDLCGRFSRVIAADMIGFGFSDKPKRYDYAIHDQADLQEALLAELGVGQCHVLAHDYGDTVAQELLARRTRAELLSVCFLNGGLFPETHRARFVQRVLAGPLGPALARLVNERSFRRSFSGVFAKDTKPTRAEISDLWRLVAENDGPAVFPKLIGYMEERKRFRERWVGALVRATIPLRVIDGADDPVSGAHMVARYREIVPNPDVILLHGVGHYPQLEAPRAVLDGFLDHVTRCNER
ncbi:MAG TPA: alpha/beta hydrolase [Polyangiaceae bacterium]